MTSVFRRSDEDGGGTLDMQEFQFNLLQVRMDRTPGARVLLVVALLAAALRVVLVLTVPLSIPTTPRSV
jgi:hypothetical protein